MKKTKAVLALILATLLSSACLLTGCNGETQKNSTTTTATTTTTAQSPEAPNKGNDDASKDEDQTKLTPGTAKSYSYI